MTRFNFGACVLLIKGLTHLAFFSDGGSSFVSLAFTTFGFTLALGSIAIATVFHETVPPNLPVQND